MKIAVFDIDGTLLQTSGVDDECYARAMAELFGIEGISTDWGSYTHSTDGAILGDLLRERLGRAPTEEDARKHQAHFAGLLAAEAALRPERFAPTPGAAALLAALPRRGWRTAIATGGWRISAQLKLRCAGLAVVDVPAAYADDHPSREEIIRTAVRRTVGEVETPGDAVPVYLGDGTWDARAAQRLGIGFVGVAREPRAAALRAAGAERVLADFTDLEEAVEAIEAAAAAVRGRG